MSPSCPVSVHRESSRTRFENLFLETRLSRFRTIEGSSSASSFDTWLSVDDSKRLTESLVTMETEGEKSVVVTKNVKNSNSFL